MLKSLKTILVAFLWTVKILELTFCNSLLCMEFWWAMRMLLCGWTPHKDIILTEHMLCTVVYLCRRITWQQSLFLIPPQFHNGYISSEVPFPTSHWKQLEQSLLFDWESSYHSFFLLIPYKYEWIVQLTDISM